MYISKEDQKQMINLINEYLVITKGGKEISKKSNQLMNNFFTYADKIILGIINAYRFTRFAERDDLIQEARMAIILSIHKQQFKPAKGTIFNFISVVSSRNLINYTTKLNRNYTKKSNADIDIFYNNESLTFYQDFDKNFLLEDTFAILLEYFQGKPRLIKLTELLIEYFETHRSSRFVKKHFINFAKGHNFSSAMVNTFFEMIARAKNKKEILDFIQMVEEDKPRGKDKMRSF